MAKLSFQRIKPKAQDQPGIADTRFDRKLSQPIEATTGKAILVDLGFRSCWHPQLAGKPQAEHNRAPHSSCWNNITLQQWSLHARLPNPKASLASMAYFIKTLVLKWVKAAIILSQWACNGVR